jgi:hypothetical protein
MKGGNIDAALVTQDAVKGMHGLACGAGDHLLVERGIPVGDRGVDLDDRIPPVVMRWNGPLPQHQSAKTWSFIQRHKIGAVP